MKNCFLYKCIYFGLFWNEDDNIFVYIVYYMGINYNFEVV